MGPVARAITIALGAAAALGEAKSAAAAGRRRLQGRALMDIDDSGHPEETYTESVADACQLPGSIDAFFRVGNIGEVCQLSASVIGSQIIRRYEFYVAQQHKPLSIQATVEIFEGSATLYMEHQNGDTLEWEPEPEDIWASGPNSRIYLPSAQPSAGSHAFVLISDAPVTSYSMRLAIFRADEITQGGNDEVLRNLRRACCPPAGCEGVLAALDGEAALEICTQPGVHCNNAGEITHLDLSQSGMSCPLDRLFALGELSALEVLQLADNDLSGTVADVTDLLAPLANLQFLELGDLPKLTGTLPPDCAPPFANLIHLGLSDTGVTGALPACLFQTVHQLEIARTGLSGPFPELPTNMPLRYLVADQVPGAPAAFTGKMPDLALAPHLHFANLTGHRLTGALIVAHSIQSLSVAHNLLDRVVAGPGVTAPSNLQALEVSHNRLTGPLPDFITKAPNLVMLRAEGNQLTALPSSWANSHLHVVHLGHNVLEGNVPAAWGSLPYLRVIAAPHNRLGGTLDAFSAALEDNNLINVLDLSNNALRGQLYGPQIVKMAMFTSAQWEDLAEDERDWPHALLLPNNELGGQVSEDVLQAYSAQLIERVNLRIDLSGNDMLCPEDAAVRATTLENEQVAMLGCTELGGSGGGGGLRMRVATALFVLIALVLLAAGAAYIVHRRRARNFYRRDAGIAAAAYVGRTGNGSLSADDRNGSWASGTGWLTGRPAESKAFSSSIPEPGKPSLGGGSGGGGGGGGGRGRGLLGWLRSGAQSVGGLFGAGGASHGSTASAYDYAAASLDPPTGGAVDATGAQLPVSGRVEPGARLAPAANGNVSGLAGTGTYGGGGGDEMTAVEMASPMSDISAASIPGPGAATGKAAGGSASGEANGTEGA